MFRHTIPIGRFFGIAVELDYSWFLILGLLTWMLAVSYYPAEFHGWSAGVYWLLGGVTAVMLFVSVLLHEFGHSLVAMRYGIRVPRITLFLFGGVSQIAAEPTSAAAEFWIAIAGPAVSFALALLFWELRPLVSGVAPLLALVKYLALINLMLGLFNLIPGSPLDGGHVFQAIVWGATRNYQRATQAAATAGRFIGFAFIFLGVWQALGGNFFNGLWIAFIGWFIESAAGSQLMQQMLKGLLTGHKVSEVMDSDFDSISADVTLQDLVDHHVLAHGQRSFIVQDGSGTPGLLTLTDIKRVPRSSWPTTSAEQVMIPAEKLVTIDADASAWSALEKMGRDGVNQLPVLRDRAVVGMLSRQDLLHYLRVLQAINS
jgi:Zn-dependent protease/CBS domain-containing protein